MPKYRFVCSTCLKEEQKYARLNVDTIKCSCGAKMARQLPSSGSQKVLEVIDNFTNIKHTADQVKQDKERKTEYFWEVEVPRLIQTYSIETCLEEKWLVYNDKGELVINKPPSKR